MSLNLPPGFNCLLYILMGILCDSGVNSFCVCFYRDRVVGWPPIRSHRRHSNTLSTSTSQTISNVHDVDRHCAFHVKVNMDGIRIGRKVDLYSYTSYEDLLSALEEMFHSPTGKFPSVHPYTPHLLTVYSSRIIITFG